MYNESQFKDCVFNPFSKKEMVKAYPRLLEICPEGYETLPFFDKVLRYVCFLYDPKSPLVVQERDLNYRKQKAAELAGFSFDNDDSFLQELYESRLEWAVNLTMRFLMRYIKQRQWALICALEFKFWEGIRRIMLPVTKGDRGDKEEMQSIQIKATISDETHKDLSRLDTLYSDFFGDDSGLVNSAKNTGRITPEGIAIGDFAK